MNIRPRNGMRQFPLTPSRFTLRDLLAEATAGIVQRPGRSGLTLVGMVLGIGSFVAILGLTATAAGQISSQFNALKATQVTVTDSAVAQGTTPGLSFPTNADSLAHQIHGVTDAGVYWQVIHTGETVSPRPQSNGAADSGLSVLAASPGLLPAAGASLSTGRTLNSFDENRREDVAVLGATAAARLGVNAINRRSAVFIGNHGYTVVGIIDEANRLPSLMLAIIIPRSTALARYGAPQPANPASMMITTRLGAAATVASQIAIALQPEAPADFTATAPPDPRTLTNAVNGAVNSLFLLLAVVALIIGAIGIANTTLVAILERTAEIGLRRALGARRQHIIAQFLAESAALGTIGGLIGTALAIVTVLGVALTRHWTAILAPATVFPAPFAGTALGVIAGLYPSIRAGRIEPVEALRR